MSCITETPRDGDVAADPAGSIRQRFPELYEELRAVAQAVLDRRRRTTVTATDLVHEAFLELAAEEHKRRAGGRLADQPTSVFEACFGATCRDVLVDRGRRRAAQKRGGQRRREPLGGSIAADPGSAAGALVVRDAIETLRGLDPVMARVVEMRVLRGLTVPACARLLGVSPRTVDRKWAFARAWLRDRFAF